MLQVNNTGNKNQFITGFFGKLPVYADFIKHNAANNEIQVLDSWIQEGLALAKIKYKEDWKNYYQNCPGLNFIYPYTGTENLIIGLMTTSSDKSGRSYPFIIFSIIKKNNLRDFPNHILPLTLSQMFSSFREFLNNNSRCEEVALLRSSINDLRVNIPEASSLNISYKKFTAEKTISELIDSEITNSAVPGSYFNDRLIIADNLVAAEFPFKSEWQMINSYCIQMFQKIFKNEALPGIFWTDQDSGSNRVFLLFMKSKPANFTDLIVSNKIKSSENEIIKPTSALFRGDILINENIILNDFINSLSNYLN